MGRKAPEPEYEIIKCGVQSAAEPISGYFSTTINQPYGVVTVLPIGATGNSVTDTIKIGTSNSPSFYPDKALVFINDENVAINANTTISSFIGRPSGTTFPNEIATPAVNYIAYQTVRQGQSFVNEYASVQNLSITGVSVNRIASGNTITSGQVLNYIPLNENSGLFLSFRNQSSGIAQGKAVRLSIISFTSTGIVPGSGLNLPFTANAASGSGGGLLVIPTIAKDLSYTGDVSRVLVGYQPVSGASSGNLCALLVEISGNTFTTGDLVSVRSLTPTRHYDAAISVTYHSGIDSNCFVIGTTSTGQISGELIAVQPPSGVTLSGYFGSPVTIGTAAKLRVTALNTYTGDTSYGVSVYGAGTIASDRATVRMYSVSGTEITTGVPIVSGVFTNVLISGNRSGLSTFSWAGTPTDLPSGIPNPPVLLEISSTLQESGLISYIAYGALTGAYTSGDCYINYVHVPYSLTTSGTSHYITLSGRIANQAGHLIPGYQFLPLSGNPYGGVHGSFVFFNTVNPDTANILYGSGLGFSTLKSTTGFFPSGVDVAAISSFAGSFFTGINLLNAGVSLSGSSFNNLYARSDYTLGSGSSLILNPRLFASGTKQFTDSSATPLIFSGTYPNITGVTLLLQEPTGANVRNMYETNFTTLTGVQEYVLRPDIFKTPILKSAALNAATGFIERDPEAVGIVINPDDSGVVDNTIIFNSGNIKANEVIVKTAKTKKAQRELLKQCLKGFKITDNRGMFE
jgi:hypothetical protein